MGATSTALVVVSLGFVAMLSILKPEGEQSPGHAIPHPHLRLFIVGCCWQTAMTNLLALYVKGTMLKVIMQAMLH